MGCHGGVKKAGGMSFIFREEALGKGESGKAAIVPFHPEESELYLRITHHDKELKMPLEKPPLNDKEIGIIKKWISQGAEWEEHWAFVAPKPQEVPNVYNRRWPQNGIDNFLRVKMTDNSLKPNPKADAATLFRRVSLDITGLPPTPEAIDRFVNDPSHANYEKIIDTLLASPHFGEKWATMWLDLARYADTKGYEKDLYRNIWPYRDYVIRSFNQDKPYNLFVKEQLAGDLLPNPTDDQIIATAFHRNTMNNDEGGTNNEEYRLISIIDRVNTTFEALQGITMGCVQCHGHPYDPIRHEEYYKFMDFVNQTADADLPDEHPSFAAKKDFDMVKAKQLVNEIIKMTGEKSQSISNDPTTLKRQFLPAWVEAEQCEFSSEIEQDGSKVFNVKDGSYIGFKSIDLTYVKNITANVIIDKGCDLEVRIENKNGLKISDIPLKPSFGEIQEYTGTLKAVSGKHDVYFIFKKTNKGYCDAMVNAFKFEETPASENSKRKKIQNLRTELSNAIVPKQTPVMQELPNDKKRATYIFKRGNWMSIGDTVTASVPKVLNPFPKNAPANRLGMAEWITSNDNPLTARVAVNRIWEQIFGLGIVETLEDFGSQGNAPSHPELLDYMAYRFMNDQNWSMKTLIKEILITATYQQSADISKDKLEKDSKNIYLSRAPRVRLSGEQVRDQALFVSGLLNKKLFGKPVMPHQPNGIWQVVYNEMSWKLSEGDEKYRRAIYTFWRRTSPYPTMLTFDGPSRDVCTSRRIRTNTPLQALISLNDTVYTEAAMALAEKALNSKARTIDQKINICYKTATCRELNESKALALKNLYQKSLKFYQKNKNRSISMVRIAKDTPENAALTVVCNAILNLDEVITKN